MSQQQSPAPNQPLSRVSTVILWIGVGLLLATAILGTYAILAKLNAVISIISFILALLAIPIGILQVAPHLLPHAQRTIKMGLLILGMGLLIASLVLNGVLILRPQAASNTHANTLPTSVPTSVITPTPTITPPSVPTLVQKNLFIQSQDTQSSAVIFPESVITGDLIVVAITQFRGAVSSVKDNHGNTYIQVTAAQHANPSSDYVQMYYAKNVTGGATTVTVTFSIAGGNLGIYEYSGLDKTSPLDQVTTSVGQGVTPNGGILNTTKDSELCFAVGVDDDGGNTSLSPGSGYTLENQEDDSSHHERFYAEARISARGSYPTDFSIAVGSHWAVIGASFKPT